MNSIKQYFILTPLILSLMLVVACDRFFVVRGEVVDAETGNPLSGIKATLVLDKGVAEPDHTIISQDDGVIFMGMNEPYTAWATLTLEKQG